MPAPEISPQDLHDPHTPGDGWYIIEASGEHPCQLPDGGQLTQQLTPEVLAGIAAAGVPAEGLPIDRDHTSLDAHGTTEAMGWVRELALCQGNLAARIEWTPPGQELIAGRIYKHFSTVYPPASAEDQARGSVAPTHLIGLALTNQPNNKTGQPPITNREPAATNNNPTTMNPELLALLGLPEGATEEDVLGAVRALQSAANTAAEAEADALINAAEEKEGAELTNEEKAEAKEELLTNRAHGIKYLGLLCRSKRAPEPAPARRYAGKTPPPLTNRRPADEREKAIQNRAQALIQEAAGRGTRLTWWSAVERARNESRNEALK